MPSRGIEIREIRALRQNNLFAYFPVLNVVIDIGEYEEKPSNSIPGFVERLTGWLPGLHEHECSLGRPGGFVERLHRGTYLAHILEHVTIELQCRMGFDIRFGRARGTGELGVYRVIIAYQEEEPARAALDSALRLVLAAMNNEHFDVKGGIEKLLLIADEYRLGPSTAAIVRAARRRDIPVTRLTPTGSLVQLGYGKYQKRIIASETSNTSAIAVELCQEKPMTNRMLRSVGVPVPEGQVTSNADDAWQAAQAIGLPVVLKPIAGNQGKGVSINLRSEAEVRGAYRIAQTYDACVLVERQIDGLDYRLLVVNGNMIAAARRDPAKVIGDGQHTIEQLVGEVNMDPRRRPGHSNPLTQIRLDDAADLVLAQQQMSRTSIPPAGVTVRLRQNSNLSTGGTAVDVTDDVHPDNAKVAELAAQFLALDVAGVDVFCKDIARPLNEQGGAILEVNAAPGLRMHLFPSEGQKRDVAKPIVDMLYPDGKPTKIPIIAVTGTNGKTTVARLIAHICETAKMIVGLTTTDGIYIGRERIMSGDCSGPRSAQAVLLHPKVDVAVLETARGGILREGLGYDSCTVGIVTNISEDHLGMSGINTIEDLAKVKQVVIEAVEEPDGTAVLNADDPLVAEMAAATKARIVYFSLHPDNPVITSHLNSGGSCVLTEGNSIILAVGDSRTTLIELSRVGFTTNGALKFQIANALAATAAAWAADVNPAMIARALTTFTTDFAMVPGRFNIAMLNNTQIVLDYAHNAAAIKALGDAVKTLSVRRTILVAGLPGDRRGEDLIKSIQQTHGWVDEYILHDLKDRRDRAVDEVPQLLRQHIPAGSYCEIAYDQVCALHIAWKRAQPGDRIVVLADEVDETVAAINSLTSRAQDDTCESPTVSEHLLQQSPDAPLHAFPTF